METAVYHQRASKVLALIRENPENAKYSSISHSLAQHAAEWGALAILEAMAEIDVSLLFKVHVHRQMPAIVIAGLFQHRDVFRFIYQQMQPLSLLPLEEEAYGPGLATVVHRGHLNFIRFLAGKTSDVQPTMNFYLDTYLPVTRSDGSQGGSLWSTCIEFNILELLLLLGASWRDYIADRPLLTKHQQKDLTAVLSEMLEEAEESEMLNEHVDRLVESIAQRRSPQQKRQRRQ